MIVEEKNSSETKQEDCAGAGPQKPIKRIQYIGVWAKNKAGNNPIICYHPDFAAEMDAFLEPLEKEIIKASIQLEEKLLITRLNLRGLSNNVMELLGKVSG